MYDDTIQLILEIRSVFDGIFSDSIYAYKEISGKPVTFTIIESNYIGEIVMLKILLIDIQYIIVWTENYGNISYTSDLAFSYQTQPSVICGLAFEYEVCILKIIWYHAKNFRKSTILYKKFEIKIIISNFTGQNGI